MMLEGQIIEESLLPEFMQQMKILLKEAWSSDVIRLISTCIVNTLPKGITST